MKVMILAAGRGERMRPLTDHCPKPMLKVAGLPLLEHHIKKLAKVGIVDIIINHAWQGHMIESYFSSGAQWQVNIAYSAEKNGALETAGGIINALDLLQNNTESNEQVFLVVNGDIYTDFDFSDMPQLINGELPEGKLAHLWLVQNPEHNRQGDFEVENGVLKNKSNNPQCSSYTYSGIGLYHLDFFKGLPNSQEKLSLGPILRAYAKQEKLSASLIADFWTDVGTPQRLEQLNQRIK